MLKWIALRIDVWNFIDRSFSATRVRYITQYFPLMINILLPEHSTWRVRSIIGRFHRRCVV